MTRTLPEPLDLLHPRTPPPGRAAGELLTRHALAEPVAADAPFDHAGWSFTLAPRGPRLLVVGGQGPVQLRSRQQVDVSARFPELVDALAALPLGATVFDAEVTVLGASGREDLAALQARLLSHRLPAGFPAATLMLHDLLLHDGRDVQALPWAARRQLLRELPLDGLPALRPSLGRIGEGRWLQAQAAALGRSGTIAKRLDAPYRPGRSGDVLRVGSAAPDGALP